MRRRMTSLSCCANINATERVLSSLVSASSPSSASSSRANSSLAVALFARRRRGRMTTTTSASFSAPGGERKRFARCCFASQSLSTELASKSRISDIAVRNNSALFLLKDARRRRREDDGFQSLRNLKTLSGRAALASGGDFGRLGVRARVSFSFVSFSSLSLSLFATTTTRINKTPVMAFTALSSRRESVYGTNLRRR